MAKMRKVFLAMLFLLVAVLSGTAVEPSRAGGWAVVTLEELPADVAAERPFTLRFAVRQHGLHLMEGLTPAVTAAHPETGESVTVTATETGEPSVYAASLTLPAAGIWRWSIAAFAATYPVPPLTVRLAAAAAPPATSGIWAPAIGVGSALLALGMTLTWRRKLTRPRLAGLAAALLIALLGVGWYGQRPLSLAAQFDEAETAVAAERGEALFVAKGCIQCHQNGNVTLADNHAAIGPDRTTYKAGPGFLRLWLADPAGVNPETTMPDLDLSEMEIETLIAFLDADAE